MIYDRTTEDVAKAISIRDTKVKSFESLTDEEVAVLEKGTITADTLNRIEEKQTELKGLFTGLGYYNVYIVNKSWIEAEIFNETEFARIVANVDVLRKAFFVYSDTPATPAPQYHFQTLNDIEKILYDLDVMINDVQSFYRECGTFECGEE